MEIYDFIKPELVILIPVLYLLGVGFKKSKLKDNYIPLSLGIVAVLLSSLWVLATSDIFTFKDVALAIFTSITQGILTAGASVYINQLYIQSSKK